MTRKDCCTPKEEENEAAVKVSVTVDVPKIVKYSCFTGVLIVAIIFSAKCFLKMLDMGLLKVLDKTKR